MQLKVMNDILDINNEFSILNSLFYQVCPSKVITSSKLTPKFISALKVLLHGDTKDFYVGKDLTDQSRLILLQGKEFSKLFYAFFSHILDIVQIDWHRPCSSIFFPYIYILYCISYTAHELCIVK